MNDYTESWDAMLAALRNTADEEPACNQIPDELFAAYAEKLRRQEEIEEHDLLPVQTHIRQCPDCSRLVADLAEVLDQTEQMLSMALPVPAPFELDFLAQGAEPAALPERVRQAFAQGYGWVQDLQGALWIDLDEASGPGSMPDYLPVTKRSLDVSTGAGDRQEGEILCHVAIGTDELDDLDVEVTGTRQGEAELCTISVKASVPSRWPQVGGLAVELVVGSEIRRGETGLDDQAVFENLSVRDLPRAYVRLLAG